MVDVLFDTPIHTGDQSVDRVLNAGLPVVLFFQNDTSAPAIDAALQRLARENAGKLLIARVRLSDNPATAARFQIRQAPAVVTLRNGQTQSQAQGVGPAEVERHVAFLLGRGPRPEAAPQTPPPAPRAAPARPAAGARPQPVTDQTFDREVMQSSVPVLVDFWAVWCGPCRMVEPTVEKLASELAGSLRVAKVNVDENPYLAQRFGVQSIPTMLIMRDGKVVDRWSGALPDHALRSRVRTVLGKT